MRQDVGDLRKTPGSIVEEFILKILPEGTSRRREGSRLVVVGDGVPREREVDQREWTTRTTQKGGNSRCKES
jgi:hypothetical protein